MAQSMAVSLLCPILGELPPDQQDRSDRQLTSDLVVGNIFAGLAFGGGRTETLGNSQEHKRDTI